MRISDWSSDVCSSDLTVDPVHQPDHPNDLIWPLGHRSLLRGWNLLFLDKPGFRARADKSADWNRGAYLVEGLGHCGARSEEHTSELQSLMRISYAVFCLKKKKKKQ